MSANVLRPNFSIAMAQKMHAIITAALDIEAGIQINHDFHNEILSSFYFDFGLTNPRLFG